MFPSICSAAGYSGAYPAMTVAPWPPAIQGECHSKYRPPFNVEARNRSLRSADALIARKTSVFRLIDVRTKAIVTFKDIDVKSLRYVALSYVWGSAQRLAINQSNKLQLGADGSLSGKVTPTIEDAMAVTD